MKGLNSNHLSLVGSFLIHVGIAGSLSLGADRSLIIGSVKGSAPAATVSFDLIEQAKPAKPAKKKSAKAKLFEGPSAVVVKKKNVPKKVEKPLPPKVASRAKAKNTTEGANRPVGLVGFDLRNVKGNLSPELNEYFFGLRSDIERKKKYPKMAKRLRQTGRVVLSFTISRGGLIERVNVTEPSEFKSLNESARKLVAGLKGKYPLPEEIQAEKIEVKLPVNYSL